MRVEIDSLYGAYLMAAFPVDDNVSVYALFGHSELEASASYGNYAASDKESSSSYGFGARYNIREAYDARIEIMEMADDVRALSFGLSVNF